MAKQLIDYLPEVLKNIEDYRAIIQVEQLELTTLEVALKDLLKDNFIQQATQNGVLRFEKIYAVTPKATDTIADRKFRILARMSEELPYTHITLKERLIKLCGENGYTCEINHSTYTLKVRIELIVKSQYKAVESLLNRMTPANLVIDLDLRYNQHIELAVFAHQKLASYTQQQLRDEVIS